MKNTTKNTTIAYAFAACLAAAAMRTPAAAASGDAPPVRMAYNYCTLAYTAAGWQEGEWRAEIERLAKKGYNAALVMAGMAKTWQLTLRDFGASEEQIREFIPDEWAQPWWLMGNLEGEGGPLSGAEVEKDAEMGRAIVLEMKARGIRPVLQGFNGIVPRWSPSLPFFKGAKFVEQGNWGRDFARPTLLAPTDPAFPRAADAWYANLRKVYGIDAVDFLAGDLFHEGGKKGDLDVTACFRAVQAAQQRAFPGAVWMVQGWGRNPTKEAVAGLDPRFTIVEKLVSDLSLSPDRTGTGYGELPWIWCEVLNFGGNMGLVVRLKTYAELGRAAKGAGAATFRGYGSLSESRNTTLAAEDLFEEMMTRPAGSEMTDEELGKWLVERAHARYGFSDVRIDEAWRLLLRSVYACPEGKGAPTKNKYRSPTSNKMTRVPDWGQERTERNANFLSGYRYWKTADVVRAAELFTEVGAEIAAKRPSSAGDGALCAFTYDWANVLRQAVVDRAAAILGSGMKGSQALRKAYLECFAALDDALACVPEFRLDYWENQARAKAGERGARAARRMFTTWKEPCKPHTLGNDYARREYAGLLRGYYMKRWETFFGLCDAGTGGDADQDEYKKALNALELETWKNGVKMEPMPRDNVAALAVRAKAALSLCKEGKK